MEEIYKDIERWINEQQDEEIKKLADILVEGWMYQLTGNKDEPTEVYQKKVVKNQPKEFYY